MSIIRNNSNRVRRTISENIVSVRVYNKDTSAIEDIELTLQTKATEKSIQRVLDSKYRLLELISEKTKSVEYSMTFSEFKKHAERLELIDGKEVK